MTNKAVLIDTEIITENSRIIKVKRPKNWYYIKRDLVIEASETMSWKGCRLSDFIEKVADILITGLAEEE